ncbi:MAG TPA: aspartate-semialdehyde dehydrogenase [Flavobacteriales bacterium]|nr:aspartate-semialdehyde dehydrogenase [Flavobacteriales bacterium]HRO39511.1 aspartate-semialdehyde dehydrogenase [Flavobacteriales bacterium]HRP81913.1 aspartate-semialdehyde dehydrogenase [Flavobacteriales bacterium]HRQ83955.1 aspartate-semialdehyde dehydrogenase [Flavobacteriales bacterium]
MRIAVVGATGMVGGVMLHVLEERMGAEVEELIAAASEKSVGKMVHFRGRDIAVVGMEQAVRAKPDIALFSAGGGTSLEWAPKFAAAGTIVIDNSSAWRMDAGKLLVVPEINGALLAKADFRKGGIIANPNCSTIQLVMALAPLHKRYQVQRVVVSTYQSVTGTGLKAMQQMEDERNGREGGKAYPYPIDKNVLARCDDFTDNGYTKEEMKLVNETHKILDPSIRVTATAVRVPVTGGHSESVNVQFAQEYELADVRALLDTAPGVEVVDDPSADAYPMPLHAHGKDAVFVGRLRRDESQANTLNMWVVADNLRKGAATNAVQIAQELVRLGVVREKHKLQS